MNKRKVYKFNRCIIFIKEIKWFNKPDKDTKDNKEKMPIRKYYEVTCEVCFKVINHYNHYKPSLKQLRKDCGIVRINNGNIYIICKDCAEKINKGESE